MLVERPRAGWRVKLKRARLKKLGLADALPARMGALKSHKVGGSESKGQRDHFAPLRRYLARQVGRPWRKVYAEICEHADGRSTMGDHVRLHVEHFVAQPTIGRDGEWLWRGRPFHRVAPSPRHLWQPLYVDPRDGILKRVKKAKARTH